MKVLMVITSHDQLGNTGRKTGFWLEELAAPYEFSRTLGLRSRLRPRRAADRRSTPRATNPSPALISRSGSRRTRLRKLSSTRPFASTASSRKVSTVSSSRVAMARCGISPKHELHQADRVLPCRRQANRHSLPLHGCAASLRQDARRQVLVQGKEVTGFTNGEEEAMGLTKVVPFLVEDEMLRLGAVFSKVADWGVHVVSDGLLITGQNPASSDPAAKTLMAAVKQKAKPHATARAS